MMRKFQIALGVSALLLSMHVFAEPAPVEDLGQPAELEQPSYLDGDSDRFNQEQPQARLTVQQRVNKLEQQIRNLFQNSQSNTLAQLQEQLQQLRGQLDKTQHDIAVLAQQQKQFYSDLNSRITAQKQLSAVQPAALMPGSPGQATVQNNTVLTAKESQAYRDAFELLKAKQYDEAIMAFQKYLMQYPDGHYVVNSNYWLGEVYYLQGKPTQAKKAFTVVVKNFPNSQKIADAMLKLAIIAIDAGDTSHGREILDRVQQQYPGTTAARLAALRAQELRLSS